MAFTIIIGGFAHFEAVSSAAVSALHTIQKLLLLPAVMAVSGAQQHPDWEWIFIPNMANALEMEEELADPRSWYLFARNYPANFLEKTFSGLCGLTMSMRSCGFH